MRFRLLILAFLGLFFVQSYQAFSQGAEANPLAPGQKSSAIYLGPVLGYNRSMHSVDLSSFVDDPLCPFFTNGANNGFYAGMTYEHLFGDVVGSKHSLIARVVYSTLPASFTKDGDRYPSLVDAGNEQYTTVESATKHTIEVSYNIVSLELMYKFNVVGNLGLTAGPTFDFPIKKTLDQRYEITEPDNVQFKQVDLTQPQYQGYKYENNDRTLVVYSGDIPDAAGFRFALKAGIQYEIIMKGRWYVVPSVYYNLGLTNIGKKDAKTESWKVSAFQAGVDVRFAL